MRKAPEIFISSAHYGLEDLRGALQASLSTLGVTPLLSSENGFPVVEPSLPAYAQCIKVLEQCLMVVGIIDKRYGTSFSDWGKYTKYSGLSPTHGELRHAIKKKIPLNIFVRKGLWIHYETYRTCKEKKTQFSLPNGYDIKSFELLEELKLAKPTPWIEQFDDVRDVIRALRLRLLGYMADALAIHHKLNNTSAEALRKKIMSLNPKTRTAIEHAIDNNPQALELLKFASSKKAPAVGSRKSKGTSIKPLSNGEGGSLDKALAYVDLASALIRIIK